MSQFSIASPSWAQRAYTPEVSVEREHITINVNPDGTYTNATHSSYRILTASGARLYGSREIEYSGSQEEILSLDAWTESAQGDHVAVLPSAIRDREEDNRGGVAKYSDTKVRAIIYPRVAVGSRISYRMLSRRNEPSYPGEFSKSFVFSPNYAFEDWQITFVLPASRALHIDKRGVEGGLVKTADGLAHYTFRYRNDKVTAPERDTVGLIHFGAYLFVSTMPNMQTLGQAARKFFEPNVKVTEEIRDLAQELTAGLTSEREKVRALYNWVAKNIRYVSVALGKGRLVPHPASEVLRNRYGDCKDHVVLLEALLSALDIASSPAMINLGASHIFSKIGAHYPINHVITYVPSLDLYLDSTDAFAPFGTLSPENSNKPTVLTSLERIGHTPALRAQDHLSKTEVRMQIRPDGTIEGTAASWMTGYLEHENRLYRFYAALRAEDAVVRELLFRFNETGTGTLRSTDPEDITKPYVENARFTLDARVNMPGRGGMTIPVGLAPGAIAWIASVSPEAHPRFPTQCRSRVLQETYVLRFPPGVVIDEIPSGVQFVRAALRYESTFTRDGQAVTVNRTLRVQQASSVCGLNEQKDWRDFHQALQRDLRSQILYR